MIFFSIDRQKPQQRRAEEISKGKRATRTKQWQAEPASRMLCQAGLAPIPCVFGIPCIQQQRCGNEVPPHRGSQSQEIAQVELMAAEKRRINDKANEWDAKK